MDADVVVVGAGLAGLRAATELSAQGREVVVLEAGDAVGGRIRTDRVDGFLVDRGFQLLNPAYPAVRRWVDLDALALQSFGAGVAARTDERLLTWGHPLRAPRLLPATLAGVGREPGSAVALLRWLRPLLHRPGTTARAAVERGTDRSLRDSLDAAGVRGTLRRILDAFFAGVVLDDTGTTSAAFARLLTAMFAQGTPGLPVDGMQALPQQLADGLGHRVRLGSPVSAVRRVGSAYAVDVDGVTLSAAHVVVAAGPAAAERLTGIPRVPTHGVVTHWFATPTAPSASALLHVDARAVPSGPLVNTSVVSNAAPSYAPPGRHLVAASALMGPDRALPTEAEMRRHAGELFGADVADWESIARYEVAEALPAQAHPLNAEQPVRLPSGVVVCGDHRDTASIQGALVSGHRAARALAG